MENLKYPLVSIVVITYNSSKYVLETLESTKAQTYQNIELIVTDDCSTDNTVEICRAWIEDNKERFVRTELVAAEKNTGTPANCNRGVNAAKGEWIKWIAGDDILDVKCIDKFINVAINDNFAYSFMVSNKCTFKNNSEEINVENISEILNTTPKKQLLKYACEKPTISPFVIFKRDVLLDIPGFDETYRLLEDSPFLFKALQKEYYFRSVEENLVYYRLSESSVSNTTVISDNFKNELNRFNNDTIKPFLFSKGLFFNATKLIVNTKAENISKTSLFLKVTNKLAKIELNLFLL